MNNNYFCEKCGCHWATHNDDGSCVEDEEIMIKHTPECETDTQRKQKIISDWKAKWPKYCRSCRGYGGHISFYDPSPSRVSLSAGKMMDMEPCEICVYSGICARCGEKVQTDAQIDIGDEMGVCPYCGWDPAEPDGLPDFGHYPCPCELEYEKLQEQEYYEDMQRKYEEQVKGH